LLEELAEEVEVFGFGCGSDMGVHAPAVIKTDGLELGEGA
jgi:hypothetical protein